ISGSSMASRFTKSSSQSSCGTRRYRCSSGSKTSSAGLPRYNIPSGSSSIEITPHPHNQFSERLDIRLDPLDHGLGHIIREEREDPAVIVDLDIDTLAAVAMRHADSADRRGRQPTWLVILAQEKVDEALRGEDSRLTGGRGRVSVPTLP